MFLLGFKGILLRTSPFFLKRACPDLSGRNKVNFYAYKFKTIFRFTYFFNFSISSISLAL